MEILDIPSDIILESLWFTCASLPQTFERTIMSQKDVTYHAWRIFTGKVGEMCFVHYLLLSGVVDHNFLKIYKDQALSVFWGKSKVDSYDLKLKGKTVDIKTLPESTHRYLIVPKDQYINQRKDFYVAVKIEHYLTSEQKRDLLNRRCFEVYELLAGRKEKDISELNLKCQIVGFAPYESRLWEYDENETCFEFPCYRIELSKLFDIKLLLSINKVTSSN